MHFERKRFFSCGAVCKISILEYFLYLIFFHWYSCIFVLQFQSSFQLKYTQQKKNNCKFLLIFCFFFYILCVCYPFIYIYQNYFLIKISFSCFFFLLTGRSITNMYCQQVTKLIGSIGRPLKLRFKKQPNPLLLSRPLRYAVAFQKGRIGLGLKEFKEITTSKQTSSFYGSNTSKNQNFKKKSNSIYIPN